MFLFADRSSLFGLVMVLLLVSACGTTASDVHNWGRKGQFERIRHELTVSPPAEVREAIAIELGNAKYPWAIRDLVLLSQDSSPKVRLAATEALGAYAGREVYSAILKRTADDNKKVAAAAQRILKTWGSESVYVLVEALSDANYRVRAAAAQVLGSLNDVGVAQSLMDRARQDEHSGVRREAVKALANLGATEAKPTLYFIKNTDSCPEVVLEAERALNRIGGTIFDLTMVVVPPVATSPKLEKIAQSLGQSIREALVAQNLCNVRLEKPTKAMNPNTLETDAAVFSQTLGAEQVLFARLDAEGTEVHVTLTRVEVDTGKLLQQERETGLTTDAEGLVDKAVNHLINRFK